ncbi:MAG: fibronectin type III-like domain-contianing protein [Candidatus Thorarchaeota archaeon]
MTQLGQVDIPIAVQVKDLAYCDTEKHRWRLAAGEVELQVGSSSRCDFLSETIICYED